MILFRGADHASQWYADNYPGSHLAPNVVCLHTTESGDWPGYEGGATAPNLTLKPIAGKRTLAVREHFPLDMSSRALKNLAGGVETNTLNVIQLELVGTCVKGGPGTYWPDAPEWCYAQLGEVLAQLHQLFPAIPLQAPRMWLAYGPDPRRPGISPASYGASPARMTFAQWRNFRGICGHQHVPENDHGDPGSLPIDKILGYARGGNQEDDMPEPKDVWNADVIPVPKGRLSDANREKNPTFQADNALGEAWAYARRAALAAEASQQAVEAMAAAIDKLAPGVKAAVAKAVEDSINANLRIEISNEE